MKLIDLLKVMDTDTFISVSVEVYGMRFEARHSAEFFINSSDELNNRKIKLVFMNDHGLHVMLED